MYRLIRRREKVGSHIEEKSGGSVVAVSVVVGGVEGGDRDVEILLLGLWTKWHASGFSAVGPRPRRCSKVRNCSR